MQKKNYPKYFVLYIRFQYNSNDLDRREGEYETNLNLRFNITPNKKNEAAQIKNFIPIYSIWIILNPNSADRGLVLDFNMASKLEIYKKSSKLKEKAASPYSTGIIHAYRISLDPNLSNILKNKPNIMGFLNGFFYPKTEDEFKRTKDLYDMPISDEFEEEVKNMDACLEYQFNQGLKQGLEQGLSQQKNIDIEKVTQNLSKELKLPPEKIQDFITKTFGPNTDSPENK